MRKHIIALIVATVAASAIPVAAASAYGGDFIAGIGENNPTVGNPNYFAFFAHSRTGGSDPFGFIGFAGPAGTFPVKNVFVGPVTCLAVSGNEATAVIKIGFANNLAPALAGGGDVIYIQDNGRTPRNGAPVDEIRNSLFPASDWDKFQTCPTPTDPGVPPLLKGDIVVHDG